MFVITTIYLTKVKNSLNKINLNDENSKNRRKRKYTTEQDWLLKLRNWETINNNSKLILIQDNRSKEYLPSLGRENSKDNQKKMNKKYETDYY